MKKYLLFVIPLFLCVSCKDKNATVETKEEVFFLTKTEYTILPFSENHQYLFKNAKETTLSDKELVLIEELFQKMKIQHNTKQARVLVKRNKKKYRKSMEGNWI